MESYSLYELNEYIKRVIALNFTETIWIHAEISQIRETRGQVYLELVEKTEDSEEIKAQSQAVIWYKSFLFIKNKLGELAKSILQEGIVLKAKVNVNFHERYGLKLVIEDIDPSYTLGVIEMQRQQIIERLKKEGLYALNKQLELPRVVQSIAVISSKQAAGLKDFYAQLQNNVYGYAFQVQLFHAAVQGKNIEPEIEKALIEINSQKAKYDLIVIIRGGGSKIDLAGFDSYRLGKSIANSPLPVVTGIGHEIDQNIADLVAHTSLKTPTAVANWIIDQNLEFESQALHLFNQIQESTQRFLHEKRLQLQHLEQNIHILPASLIERKSNEIVYLHKMLKLEFRKKISDLHQWLDSTDRLSQMAHPDLTLKRGFAIVSKNNQIIREVTQLEKMDRVDIQMQDGRFESEIQKIIPEK